MGEKPAREETITTASEFFTLAIVHPIGTISAFTTTIFPPQNETLRRISYWKRARRRLA